VAAAALGADMEILELEKKLPPEERTDAQSEYKNILERRIRATKTGPQGKHHAAQPYHEAFADSFAQGGPTQPAEEKPVDDKAGQEDGDFVEMPKDIQKKFNKIYKEKKAAAERNQLLEQHVIALTKKIEAVSSEVNSSKVENTVSSLKEKLQHAKSIGDDDAAAKIEDQLLELRLEKKIADKTKKETPKAEAKADNPMNGVLSRSEINIVSKWAHEEDEDGDVVVKDKKDKSKFQILVSKEIQPVLLISYRPITNWSSENKAIAVEF
jgi:hypothetical protein